MTSKVNFNSHHHATTKTPDLLSSLGIFTTIWRHPLRDMQKLHQQYGNIVRLNLGFKQVFIINDANYIKYVLQDNIKNYNKLRRLELETIPLFGEGWTDEVNRKMIKSFFDPRRFAGMDDVITQDTLHVIDRWQTFAARGQAFDVAEEMIDLSLSFTTKILLNEDFGAEQGCVADAMKLILHNFNNRAVSNFNLPIAADRKFLAAIRTLQAAVDKMIARRQQEENIGNDLLSVLQSWRHEETGEALSQVRLRERLLWILLPSLEPIARALSWVWYALSQNPIVERKLQEELKQVLGNRVPTFSDLPNLTYTKMVIQEALRLFPPFWLMGREAIADDEVGGFAIPAKSIVLFNFYGVHRNPKYWDNPEVFLPERFAPDYPKNYPIAAYAPFSIGPRACLGYNLSLMQLQLVVATLAQKFQLSLVPGHRVEQKAMGTLLPGNGIKVTAKII